jgi:hypothetical protein
LQDTHPRNGRSPRTGFHRSVPFCQPEQPLWDRPLHRFHSPCIGPFAPQGGKADRRFFAPSGRDDDSVPEDGPPLCGPASSRLPAPASDSWIFPFPLNQAGCHFHRTREKDAGSCDNIPVRPRACTGLSDVTCGENGTGMQPAGGMMFDRALADLLLHVRVQGLLERPCRKEGAVTILFGKAPEDVQNALAGNLRQLFR